MKKQQMRLSPSRLESFRLFMTEDWFDNDKMIEAITGDFVPTPQIKMGQAYHRVIETHQSTHEMYLANGNPTDQEMIVCEDGFRFAYEPCIAPVEDFLRAGCFHEVYGGKSLDTAFGELEIRTKSDAVHGIIGGEWKTTSSAIQIAKYMDSVQWKLCCWALNLKAMDYRVVQLYARKDGVIDVKSHDSIQMVWSDSLMPEILNLAHALIQYHYDQGLEEYLLPYYVRQRRLGESNATRK